MAFASNMYFIDASSKADHNLKDLDLILRLMDENGVYRTLLATNGHLPDGAILLLAKRHPERIIPTVRLSGKPYLESRPSFFRKLDEDVAGGQYRGMSEALVYHAEKTTRVHHASEYSLPIDDLRLRASLAHARKQGWPFVVHIEFGVLSREERARYKSELTKFLIANQDVAVVLIHLAQLHADEAEPLLKGHPNLYLMTSHCNPAFLQRMKTAPLENMFSGNSLSSAWIKVMLHFPDRFVFALDNVYAEHWQWQWYGEQMRLWRLALEKLPPEAAHVVAHGNAERLWRLPPETESGGVSP